MLSYLALIYFGWFYKLLELLLILFELLSNLFEILLILFEFLFMLSELLLMIEWEFLINISVHIACLITSDFSFDRFFSFQAKLSRASLRKEVGKGLGAVLLNSLFIHWKLFNREWNKP